MSTDPQTQPIHFVERVIRQARIHRVQVVMNLDVKRIAAPSEFDGLIDEALRSSRSWPSITGARYLPDISAHIDR